MLNPCIVALSRSAFESEMVLTGFGHAYAYENGKRTDVPTAVRCNIVLPAYDYEKLSVKLPLGTEIDPHLVGKPVDFSDFSAKVYCINGKVGYSVTATAVMAAKPDKP